MPILVLLGLGAAAFLFLAGPGKAAAKALLDRTKAIAAQIRGGTALYFPVADSKPDDVVTMGAPAWVYSETPDGTQAYYQLRVTTLPPNGQVDFGLSDASDPPLETYLPRSHFALGEPKAS